MSHCHELIVKEPNNLKMFFQMEAKTTNPDQTGPQMKIVFHGQIGEVYNQQHWALVSKHQHRSGETLRVVHFGCNLCWN